MYLLVLVYYNLKAGFFNCHSSTCLRNGHCFTVDFFKFEVCDK